MRLARTTVQAGVLGLVLASLAVSLPRIAAADHEHRRHHRRHRHAHRTEYVLHLPPAYYHGCGPLRYAPAYYAPPPVAGYYYDRDCDRRFSSFEIYLAHARRHHHTRLVFVATGDRPVYRDGPSWGGWVRISW
jgi:hypothetical protein